MAEFVFRDLAEKAGCADLFRVASAGTSSEEIWNGVGNPVYPPAAAKLAEHGIASRGKRARVLVPEDYDRFDLLVAMEGRHERAMHRLFRGDPQGKICRLLDFTDRSGDIPDPWYTDDFESAYRDIERGCRALLSALLEQNWKKER